METQTETTSIVQIDLNPSPIQIAPSEGLSEILSRVDRYLVVPNSDKLPAAKLKLLQKERREKAVAEVAKAFPVADDESCERASGFVAECAAICGSIVERWRSPKKKAHEAHAEVCRMESEELQAKQIVREGVDVNVNAFRVRQRDERIRQEREDSERAAAESRRLQAEADKAAAESRRLEAAALELKRQGDMKAARALQEQAAATVEKVAEIQEQAEIASEVFHESAPAPKLAGRTEKWPWVGKPVDAMVLIRAIAAGEYELFHDIPVRGGGTERAPILEFNNSVIQYYAKRLEANARIPGVEFKEELQSAYKSK